MPNLGVKASEIDDPLVLVERVAYRTERLLDKFGEKDDPVKFVKLMAGHKAGWVVPHDVEGV